MESKYSCNLMRQIIKSPQDKCEYKIIKLENGLEILLISDKNIKMSHASMIVKTGSLMEKETFGLAHFLEHMLFLGNEKYPHGEEYFEFVNVHGGKTNAFTDSIHTCYYFTINEKNMRECLDMFCNFFVNPLFDDCSIDKEINAVESEYRKNINIDAFRYKQILKEITVKTHPFRNFDVGSISTLRKPTIRQELIDFYNKYYSPDKMKLIIAHNESIDEMIKMTYIFNKINKLKCDGKVTKNIFGDPLTHGNIIKMTPLNNLHSMFLLWTINYKKEYKNFKILRYIFYLLGRESFGSISNILINYSLINELQIASFVNFGDYLVICVELKLTEYGLKNANIIVNMFTKYIEKLKLSKINKENFEMFQKCTKLNFLFEDQFQIDQKIMNIVTNICSYYAKLHESVSQSSLICEYDKISDKIYEGYLNSMNIGKLNIILSSHKFENELNMIEKWYDIKYVIEKNTMNNDVEFKFNDIHHFDGVFIPDKLMLSNNNNGMVHINNGFNIFVNHENTCVPKVCIVIELELPHVYDNVHTYVANNILLKLVNYNIRKQLYDSILCNSYFEMDLIRDKLVIKLVGFNDKIDKMLDCVKDNLLKQNVTYASFMYAKNLFQLEVEDVLFMPPFEKINLIASDVFYEKKIDPADVLNEIESCNRMEYIQFDLLADTKMQCIINGNFVQQQSDNMYAVLRKLYDEIKITKRVNDSLNWKLINCENGDTEMTLKHHNTLEDNQLCCFLICSEIVPYNSEKFRKIFAMSMLANKILSDKFFDELRTKMQLGYIVRSGIDIVGTIDAMVSQKYYVQSATHSVNEISKKMDIFFNNAIKIIKNIGTSKLRKYINGCIATIQEEKMNIFDATMEKFEEILHERYIFDNKSDIIRNFDEITPEILYDYYVKYFISDSRKRIIINCIPTSDERYTKEQMKI